MTTRLAATILGMLFTIAFAAGEEFDGVIKKAPKQAPDGSQTLPHEKVMLDTKGQIVKRFIRDGLVTKDTKVAMGKYNEQRKKWEAGTPIPGGVNADIFKDADTNVLQVFITTTEDRKAILQILVKKVGGELARADPEFDGVIKQVVQGGFWYVRVELDEKGETLKTFGLTSAHTTKDTKVFMGKYNEKEKKWEAGEPVENGLYGEPFKDLRNKLVHAHLVPRDDGKGIAQVLVRKVGGPLKK